MNIPNIPRLKGKRLDGFIGLPIEGVVKKELQELKHAHDLDHLEWIRQLIRSELPNLKRKLKEPA